MSYSISINMGVNINFDSNSASSHYNFKLAQFHSLYNAPSYINRSFLLNAIPDMYVPKRSPHTFSVWYSIQILINPRIILTNTVIGNTILMRSVD